MKKEKSKWKTDISKDEAKALGFHLGVRRTLEFLAEEGMINPNITAWLLEKEYLEELLKE